ncbi:MAG: LysM domain-containing protein [Candidatus Melainabacteria bacterium]|nr:MAG: LysM domain-containing protein [Candidatus Melainabacteria bacterium]
MGANNECSAELDGRRAAVDLAMANRPDDFTNKCWNIDQKLNRANSDYARSFMTAMNNELQDRNLLPKIELNMVTAGDTPAMQALQKNKHVETQDLIKDEDQLRDSGRHTEAMLMHRLSSNAQEIHDTHAERNFWGKNHGGINMDRINRWAEQNRADMRGALEDAYPRSNDRNSEGPQSNFAPNNFNHFHRPESNWHDMKSQNIEKDKVDPRATDYDKKQDNEINRLSKEVSEQKKFHEQLEKANELKAKVEAGVIKDAHHTVKHGETLYDMACLALHKAGRDHLTPQAIRFEEEKIRALNHLAPHEKLRSGQSLMLRTEQEVQHETVRRINLMRHHE